MWLGGVAVARTLTLLSLVALSGANLEKIAGYQPVSNVQRSLSIGEVLESLDEAVSAEVPDWAAAHQAYERISPHGITLREAFLPPSDGANSFFDVFAEYYGSRDYTHNFVSAALNGTGEFSGLDDKARSELVMKGTVLQGILMGSISHLHVALGLCQSDRLEDASGAPHHVDQSWALYACSETKGPIRLAEKRAPQFDVEAPHASEAGASQVNNELLQLFNQLQQKARDGSCNDFAQLLRQAVARMQVPIIQGLLREAFEADPAEMDEHKGADGFIEVVEGWAFARAVLPAIANCSSAAADAVEGMNTIAAGPNGPHVSAGYVALKDAVESTYPCLGIPCASVNAMVKPYKTGQLLWPPCNDTELRMRPAQGDDPVSQGLGLAVSSWLRMLLLGVLSWLLL